MNLKNIVNGFWARSHMRRLMIFGGVATFCGLVILVTLTMPPADSEAILGTDPPVTGMPVTTRRFEPDGHAAVIRLLGEVVPLWQTEITAQIDGRIVFLSKRLQVGNIVRKGELLVQIAKRDFEARAAASCG